MDPNFAAAVEAVAEDLLPSIREQVNTAMNDALAQIAEATGRTRFVLELRDDGSWSFGAPSMLSYSPRPGDMHDGAGVVDAIRAARRAAEATAP